MKDNKSKERFTIVDDPTGVVVLFVAAVIAVFIASCPELRLGIKAALIQFASYFGLKLTS